MKKFFLPMLRAVLADGVAERLRVARREVLQRVDPEAVRVELGHDVLVDPDQHVLQVEIRREDLLQRHEVAGRRVPVGNRPLAAEVRVLLDLLRPHERVARRICDLLDHRPAGLRHAVGVPPLDGERARRESRLRAIRGRAQRVVRVRRVREDVPCVVEHDVEDHVHAGVVERVHQRAQLGVGLGRVGREPRLGAQEIGDAVAVVGVLAVKAVAQHGAEPHRTDAQSLEIGNGRLHSGVLAALEGVHRSVERHHLRRRGRVVESVHQQEIHQAVAPVLGRRVRRPCGSSERLRGCSQLPHPR